MVLLFCFWGDKNMQDIQSCKIISKMVSDLDLVLFLEGLKDNWSSVAT